MLNFNNKIQNRSINSRIDTRSLLSVSDIKLDYDLKIGSTVLVPNTSLKAVLRKLSTEVNSLMSAPAPSDLNGIYSGSGSLTTETTVTMGVEALKFRGTGLVHDFYPSTTTPSSYMYAIKNSNFGQIQYGATASYVDVQIEANTSGGASRIQSTGDTGQVPTIQLLVSHANDESEVFVSDDLIRLQALNLAGSSGLEVNKDGTGTRIYGNPGSGAYSYKLPTTDPSITNLAKSVMTWTGNGSTITPAFEVQPKKYVALLTQTGTSAPVATVLENTLGGTVVWTRSDVGFYEATLTGAFPTSKTIIFLDEAADEGSVSGAFNHGIDNYARPNTLSISIRNEVTNVNTDGLLNGTSIQIIIYP
jgi:hypothetical protein